MQTSLLSKATISSVLLLSLSAAQAGEAKQGNQYSGNISVYLGKKTLDDKDWSNLDKQGSLGVISDFKKESWPFSIAVDMLVSGSTEKSGSLKDLTGSVETHLGVRKIYKLSNSSFQPYIGGGVSLITTNIEHENNGNTISKSDDSAAGYWVGTGMYYSVNNHFNLGVDVRYSQADVSLFDVERKAGGVHTGITAGYHW
jgi:opacity protein-like surface antigen